MTCACLLLVGIVVGCCSLVLEVDVGLMFSCSLWFVVGRCCWLLFVVCRWLLLLYVATSCWLWLWLFGEWCVVMFVVVCGWLLFVVLLIILVVCC